MAYDPLFMALAQAESQPSHAYRTAIAAEDAATAPIQGYLQTKQALTGLASQKAQLLDNFGKLAEATDTGTALKLMGPTLKSAGVDLSQIGSPDTGGQSLEDLQKQFQANPMSLNPKMRTMMTTLHGQEGQYEFRKELADAAKFRSENQAWQEFGDHLNSLKQEGGPLGMAAKSNLRAYRALDVLGPKATPQDVQYVYRDLDGIFQGGVPPITGAEKSQYNTLQQRWANLKTVLSNEPQQLNSPNVINHLRDIVTGLRSIDNKALNDNIDFVGKQYSHLQNLDPLHYKTLLNGARQLVSSGAPENPINGTMPDESTGNPNVSTGIPGQDGGISTGVQKPKTVRQGSFVYTLNPTTGQYE